MSDQCGFPPAPRKTLLSPILESVVTVGRLQRTSSALGHLHSFRVRRDTRPRAKTSAVRIQSRIPHGFHFADGRNIPLEGETERLFVFPLLAASEEMSPEPAFFGLALVIKRSWGKVGCAIWDAGTARAL